MYALSLSHIGSLCFLVFPERMPLCFTLCIVSSLCNMPEESIALHLLSPKVMGLRYVHASCQCPRLLVFHVPASRISMPVVTTHAHWRSCSLRGAGRCSQHIAVSTSPCPSPHVPVGRSELEETFRSDMPMLWRAIESYDLHPQTEDISFFFRGLSSP